MQFLKLHYIYSSTKYWLYSLCCTTYSMSYTQQLCIPHFFTSTLPRLTIGTSSASVNVNQSKPLSLFLVSYLVFCFHFCPHRIVRVVFFQKILSCFSLKKEEFSPMSLSHSKEKKKTTKIYYKFLQESCPHPHFFVSALISFLLVTSLNQMQRDIFTVLEKVRNCYFFCLLPYLQLSEQQMDIGEGKAPHSSTRAWKIPWKEEPGRIQSMGSQRVGLD